jgi:polyisoprenoid-binding protein YceI
VSWRCRAGLLAAFALALNAPVARAADYRISSAQSQAAFAIRMMWIHNISGEFPRITGNIHVDAQGLATVDARIDVNSVSMSSARMRRWVLQPEFFDGARYPAIRFLSQPVLPTVLTGGGTLRGWLSLRGITQAVRFELLPADCKRLASGHCVIEARGHISRSDFGMTSHRTALSDQVQLVLQIAVEAETG